MVFIDGVHSLETVTADHEALAYKVAPGGVLAIHDLFPDPAECGQAPIEICRCALASGRFEELSATKTLGVLGRRWRDVPGRDRHRPGCRRNRWWPRVPPPSRRQSGLLRPSTYCAGRGPEDILGPGPSGPSSCRLSSGSSSSRSISPEPERSGRRHRGPGPAHRTRPRCTTGHRARSGIRLPPQ